MRIGEVADAAGITTKTIRFYEDRGLLPPAERSA
ncbi:MAG: MerR family DNA-binding transcriptional regulator, partial [Corynebacterium sp.]|nr:MerR family DNA-binding transcriptional regulator [Corynebacterium sp.]